MKKLKSHTFLFVLLSIAILCTTCEIFEGPCADEDMGHLYLLTSLIDISPYTKDVYIFFKDSVENEQVFEFINEKAGHTTEQYSSTNVPCPSDANERKEFKAKTEEYYFSITQKQNDSIGISFSISLSVSLGYLNGLMVFDELSITAFPPSETGYGYGSYLLDDFIHLIANPRDCVEEFLSQYPQPETEVTLLGKSFNNVYSSSNSNLLYNYEFGIIGFKDDSGTFWVLDRIE